MRDAHVSGGTFVVRSRKIALVMFSRDVASDAPTHDEHRTAGVKRASRGQWEAGSGGADRCARRAWR